MIFSNSTNEYFGKSLMLFLRISNYSPNNLIDVDIKNGYSQSIWACVLLHRYSAYKKSNWILNFFKKK